MWSLYVNAENFADEAMIRRDRAFLNGCLRAFAGCHAWCRESVVFCWTVEGDVVLSRRLRKEYVDAAILDTAADAVAK